MRYLWLFLLLTGCDKPAPPTVIVQVVKPTVDERKAEQLKIYEACMDRSDDFYQKGWDAQCKNVYHLKPHCILPTDTSMFVVERTKIFKQECQNEFDNHMRLIQ